MDYAEFTDEVSDLSDGVYAGLPIAPAPDDDDDDGDALPGAGEVAWRLWTNEHYDSDETFERQFARFMSVVDSTEVKAIVIGCWDSPWEVGAELPIRLLAANAGRFPALRSIFLGAITSEECEISWIKQGDITPLLRAFPRLERLEVRGGDGLELSPVRHEALKVLRFESGGLPASVVRAVGDSDLPALEYLEIWLGTSDYGGDATVADMASILSGERLPSLGHLGLQDSEIQDQVAEAVASAPVVARLSSLSLAMGVFTDAGAEALLSGQPLTHLRRLDLHHHYLGDDMIGRVVKALPGVEVDLSEQEKPDDDWRYIAVAE
ncbi:STM4015 family protein [Sphaerisporangium sp. NBC_01403]|uniref:STM4015 family protein n=1 Tax=Sphaerisporangium sp. NBC_01403 TaxID=2903599 RepID=UPI0032503EA1